MFSLSPWYLLLLVIAYVPVSSSLRLLQNIQIAKASGLQYVVVPFYAYNRVTKLVLSRTLLPFIYRLLGPPSNTSWRHLVKSHWPWRLRHAPFAVLGTDTFLIVAPGGIILNTADADVISQIMARGTDFPKATHLYQSIDIYGKNVVSSEGAVWRRHRKLVGPAFNEKNNKLVWKETLDRSQVMLESWLSPDGGDLTIRTVASDSMRLSLNVISRAGLGHEMDFLRSSEDLEVIAKKNLPTGHTMTFSYALLHLLKNILYIMILPQWILKNYPSSRFQKAYEAYEEWGKYMKEIVAMKKAAVQSAKPESATIDLISQLVKGQTEGKDGKSQVLSDSEVMGNLFTMIIAGHETSANSIHFTLMLLALHPSIQRKVQAELSTIFGIRPISAWDYERDLPLLLNGLLGAVLAEELRLITPVITIPKVVCATPQQLSIDGKDVTLPPRLMVRLCIQSVHRNPKFWPDPDDPRKQANDLEEFRPARWLIHSPTRPTSTKSHPNPAAADPSAQLLDSLAASTSTAQSFGLYKPPPGSYIPFSDGQRACLGRRFAQVEILAALAAILTTHSVELAIDEWATDSEVDKMSDAERAAVWRKAKERGEWTWRNKMVCIMTLQLRGACVPVRFVRRGEERFGRVDGRGLGRVGGL